MVWLVIEKLSAMGGRLHGNGDANNPLLSSPSPKEQNGKVFAILQC